MLFLPRTSRSLVLIMVLPAMLDLSASAANKADPDLIPPDVTLSNSFSMSAPGLASPSSSPTTSTNSASPFAVGPTYQINQAAPQQPANLSTNQPTSQPTGQPSSQLTNAAATQVTLPAADQSTQKADSLAMIETEKGTILVRLFQKLAPKTTDNFIDIANTGFYNGLAFHRVEPGFCIQGGDPNGDGSGIYFDPSNHQPRMLPLETNPSLKHNAPGVVAMAHFPKNPNTASCQFYITLSPQPNLDGDYSIFGGVINGMDVVNKIAKGDKIIRITIKDSQ